MFQNRGKKKQLKVQAMRVWRVDRQKTENAGMMRKPAK